MYLALAPVGSYNKYAIKLLQGIVVGLLAGIVFYSCKPSVENKNASAGNATFTKYIAIGSTATSGFSNFGLYREAQRTAYPNLIVQQLNVIDSIGFTSPLFINKPNGTGRLVLDSFDSKRLPVISINNNDRAITGNSRFNGLNFFIGLTPADPNYVRLFTLEEYAGLPIHNFGIPYVRLADILSESFAIDNFNLLNAVGSILDYNPYFNRLLPAGKKNTSYLQLVSTQNHSFFTNWLGEDDVLFYAITGGGVNNGLQVLGGTGLITKEAVFTENYTRLLNLLTANGAKGVIATIPNPVNSPFFNTVDSTIARTIAGPEYAKAPLYIQEGNADGGTGKTRVLQPGDKILLLANSTIAKPVNQGNPNSLKGFSARYPLTNSDVLDVKEVETVMNTVNRYNQIIRELATNKKLAVADMAAFSEQLQKGMVQYGIPLSNQFILGNFYSLDGLYATPRGNAIIANEFIKAINNTYGSTIPTVNITQYPGVVFPR
jgi:hypothetical protein